MNDLRSRNRALAAVPDEGSAPTSTPPRVRPENEERNGRRMSRRQSIAERARKLGVEAGEGEEITLAEDGTAVVAPAAGDTSTNGDHKFRSSRPAKKRPVAASAEAEDAGEPVQETLDVEAEAEGEGPSSRPNRRREMSEEEVPEEDKFPWHFQFDDDEPEELQASSPLLSRAFRATIG